MSSQSICGEGGWDRDKHVLLKDEGSGLCIPRGILTLLAGASRREQANGMVRGRIEEKKSDSAR